MGTGQEFSPLDRCDGCDEAADVAVSFATSDIEVLFCADCFAARGQAALAMGGVVKASRTEVGV